MRHLLYLHGKIGAGGPTATRVGPALDFAAVVEASGARYFSPVPGLRQQRLEKAARGQTATTSPMNT
ncbi:MAG: hypothetical protein R3E51_10445 [Rhizobiaceae bacterium]